MNYAILLLKEQLQTKKFLLNSFVMLEAKYKTSRDECRDLSLHCKYDTNSREFWEKDVTIYMQCAEETPLIAEYVKVRNFERILSLPKDEQLKFILGNYGISIRYFNSIFVY